MEFLFTILVTCSQLRFACGWWPIRQRSWTVQKWQKPSPMCQPRRCGLQGNSNAARWEDVKKTYFCGCLFLSVATSHGKTQISLYVYLAATSLQFGWFLGQLGDSWWGMVTTGTGADVTVTPVTTWVQHIHNWTAAGSWAGLLGWLHPTIARPQTLWWLKGCPFFLPWPWRCQKVWWCHVSTWWEFKGYPSNATPPRNEALRRPH